MVFIISHAIPGDPAKMIAGPKASRQAFDNIRKKYGLDRGMDAVCFIGYHSMAGSADASIPHIFHGRVAELKFNGLKVGEIGLNALMAGYYGVPVVMISGDKTTCREAIQLIPEIETAPVKEAIGSYAGICFHPKRCRELIYDAVKKALAHTDRFTPPYPGG